MATSQGNTPYDLAYKGDLQSLKNKIKEDPNLIEKQDVNSRQLIHWSSLGGHKVLTEYLIEEKSEIDPRDDTCMTPLIMTCSAGKIDVARLLISKGADINAVNNDGHSSLQYACSKGFDEIVKLLLDNGCDINIQDKFGASPLHRAAAKGNTSTSELLLKNKLIKINIQDNYGQTPLHMACEDSSESTALLLVQNGARLDIQDKEERTPLDLTTKSLGTKLKAISQ